MSDDAKQKSALDCFNRGSEAIRSGNFDYAVEMFMTSVKLVPDNLLYRQALRGAERKMYKDNRKGAGMLSKPKVMAAQAKLKYAKQRTKWPDVMEAAEDALKYNPWDSAMLYELGHAAGQLGMHQIGIWILETAFEADPKNADTMRLLADYFEQTSQFDRAISAWETVKRLDPTDQDAAAKARQLAAAATIQKGKYDSGESFQETMRANAGKGMEGGPAKLLSPEERLKADIAALEAKIAEDPANVNLYVQLGDKYRDLPDAEKATAAYQKGLDATGGGDNDIKVKIQETQIEAFQRNVALIESRFNSLDKSAADYREKATTLKKKHQANRAEIAKRQVALYRFKTDINPNDFASHFELGLLLQKFNQPDEAIKSFQQARNDMQRKWEALYHLGELFLSKKNFALAENNLSQAANDVSGEENRKKVIYLRGRVAEEKGDIAQALEFYNEVAAIDYGYEDVAKRIDELSAKT